MRFASIRFASLILAIATNLALSIPALAAAPSADGLHVHVLLVAPESQLYPGGANNIGLYFKLEPGWHVYWKNAGDSGEPPRVRWTLPDGVTAGDLQFPAPKRLPLGPLMDFGYEDEVLFPVKLSVAPTVKTGEAPLHAKVSWLVCREVCIPGKAELETIRYFFPAQPQTTVSAPMGAAIWDRFSDTLPKPLPSNLQAKFQPTPDGFRLALTTGQRETEAAFFPSEQNILSNPAPQTVIPTPTGFILDLKKDANLTTNPAQLSGVLELSGGRAYEIAATPGTITAPASAPQAATGAVAKAVGLAFLGGLILNLMPCVFPVLFIKGLSLVNAHGQEREHQRAHGLVYTAGIVVSFWILVGVLLGLRTAGATLGWGFQFQSPIFIGAMAGLLFFLGLSLAGQFEIGLTLTSAGGSLARKQGYAGSFFTGVLAVIVATPCTAPFMGAAIGFALSQSAFVTFAVFTALALGLAAPYLLLTLQPAWTRLLPKPGAWMEVLKQATAVPIFATVIWLVWVLAQGHGAVSVAVLLATFLLLAIAGWILGRWPARRGPSFAAALVILAAVGLGIYGVQAFSEPVTAKATTASAEGGRWEPWSQAAVDKYRAEGRPVFVDFTASWCLSCQVNERVALRTQAVENAFRKANVALLKADWTERDDAIAQALASLGRDGVPAYALYASNSTSAPVLLPEALTPGIVIDQLAKLSAEESAASAAKATEDAAKQAANVAKAASSTAK